MQMPKSAADADPKTKKEISSAEKPVMVVIEDTKFCFTVSEALSLASKLIIGSEVIIGA